MKYHNYNIDPSYEATDGAIKWSSTGSGVYVCGERGGNRYFVKRFSMGPRYPSTKIPEPIYSEQKLIADSLTDKQAEMRKRMGPLSVDGDHIVIEEENFWDEDNMFVTITRMIPDENKDADYSTLDTTTFIKLCRDISVLIKKIHDVGVTHGDLKVKNILVQKSGSELIPYLIDFDSSYPSDYGTKTRADGSTLLAYPVVYSEGYQSPEIAIYNFEDPGVIDPATITDKTDIFTLAIIFHMLWTNKFPTVVGDACAVGEAVYMDREISFDPKFDFSIGAKNDSKFSDLLKWMLRKDFAARPNADQVIAVLEDNLEVEGAGKFDLDPHAVHVRALEIADIDTLKGMNVKSFYKVIDGGQYRYRVVLKDKTDRMLTMDEIIAAGYAKAKPASLGTLWEEDAKKIEFVTPEEVTRLGFVAVEPKQVFSKKFYYVAFASGGGRTMNSTELVSYGIACPKAAAPAPASAIPDTEKPWPEHGSDYDKARLAAKDIINVEHVDVDGEHKYKLIFTDGSEKLVNFGFMKLLKYII